MPSTGEKGFEGLLRDAVAEVIGRRLNLVKSGAQKGADAGTDPQDAAPFIVVEAKRYREGTRLALDELQGKLVDAVHARPALDVYVFGATREISRDDQDALNSVGERAGVGVLFVDWPDSTAVLPPLAVLCTLAPSAVLHRVNAAAQAQIKTCLDAITADQRFQKASEALIERLTRPDMGYLAATRSIATWLRDAFSDKSSSAARLGGMVNLLDPEIHRVRRPRLSDALDDWLRAPSAPFALLGEEGLGKSWAPLAWWHERAGAGGVDLPLTLVVPARDVADTDAVRLAARLLTKQTGIRNEAFWERRLKLWLNAPSDGPKVIFIFDGLNENFTFKDWPRLLAGLDDAPWRGKVAAVLTSRPDHWDAALGGGCGFQPPPRVQKVAPFDDEELDALLSLHGLTRSDFVGDLLPLLKIPRLCELAVRHRRAMAESGDITRERLIYEDWKDRLHRRGINISIDDAEFHQFVAGLGKKLREQLIGGADPDLSVTRKTLCDDLRADSGYDSEKLTGAISEIVDGRWMTPVEGSRHRFKLNGDLTPYALGLALVDHLREIPEADLDNRLAEFIEPIKEQDLLVALMRAAVTVALADKRCSGQLRRRLINAWFRRQNFRLLDFKAFWRLLPQDLGAFFAVAEETWLHRHVLQQGDEILIKGFSNAAERWPAAEKQIAEWCAQWLGTHWADSHKGMVLAYNPQAAGVAERSKETRRRRQEWDAVACRLDPPVPIRDGIDGDAAWLACRVLAILSYAPRPAFLPALTAWAVSRAIMGSGANYEQVAWILRLPPSDEDGAYPGAVMDEARRLLALDHPVATEAAKDLLNTLATPNAARLAESLPQAADEHWSRPSTVTADETSGILRWDYDRAVSQPRSGRAPLWAAGDLNEYATDPEQRLSDEDAAKLAGLADKTPIDGIWLSRQTSTDETDLESAEAALARWAPHALGALYRRLFATAAGRTAEMLSGPEEPTDQTEEPIRQLALNLPRRLLLLGPDELAVLSKLDENVQLSKPREDWSKLKLQLAALAEKSPSEQIAFFAAQPEGPNFDSKDSEILAPPTAEDFAEIAQCLHPDKPMAWLRGWLWYLKHVDLKAMPPGYPALVPLLTHAEPEVRKAALEAACNSGDKQLAQALFASNWRCAEGMDHKEVSFGSLTLVTAAGSCPSDQIRSRIHPQAWGFLADRDDATDDDLNAFADYVQQIVEDDFFRTAESRTHHQEYFILERPCERLVQRRGDDVVAWLQPLISGERKPRFGMFMDTFPYIDLCRALLHHLPEDGAKLWKVMRKHYDKDIFRRKDFTLLPFDAPDSEAVFPLRDFACDKATTDKKLAQLATAVIRYGRQDWLIDRIRRDLAAAAAEQPAGRTARGLWLAGMLDISAEADALWMNDLRDPPGPGWLTDVHQKAKQNYRRNGWARHWLEAFLTERDRDRAFGFHLLFMRCADQRAYGWAAKRVGEVFDTLPRAWLTHWSLSWEDLKKHIEK